MYHSRRRTMVIEISVFLVEICVSLRLTLAEGCIVTRSIGDGGYIGLVNMNTQVGDEVYLLLGCDTLMILRRIRSLNSHGINEQGYHEATGEGYFHGLMDGEG